MTKFLQRNRPHTRRIAAKGLNMKHIHTRARAQVKEEIKTEEEVKRVCSGFGDANASDYGPTPTDSSNVYGPGAGNAAAATAAIASVAAGVAGASGPSAGSTRPSWASQGAAGGAQEQAAQVAAQISAQVRPEEGVWAFFMRYLCRMDVVFCWWVALGVAHRRVAAGTFEFFWLVFYYFIVFGCHITLVCSS